MATLSEAIELLEQGDWQAAHAIVQKDSSPHGSWAHGIVHMMEGDLGNADYWYRRASRTRPLKDLKDSIAAEIAALKADISN